MRRIPLLFVMVAATASGRAPGYTVTEVWKQHAALDGKVIRVSGVVEKCWRLGCSLRENRSQNARSLSLGGSDTFDQAIQSRLGQPIVVEGRLDATCLHAAADREFGKHGKSNLVICTDRAPELRDPKIVSGR